MLTNVLCSLIVSETEPKDFGNPLNWKYNWYTGYMHLGAGLSVGFSALASGLAIGVSGAAGVRGIKHTDILIAVILMMIFAEAIALYGFIVAIVLASSS